MLILAFMIPIVISFLVMVGGCAIIAGDCDKPASEMLTAYNKHTDKRSKIWEL